MFIFPGVGLGVVASKCHRVTDKMMFTAAQALSECVSEEDVNEGRVCRLTYIHINILHPCTMHACTYMQKHTRVMNDILVLVLMSSYVSHSLAFPQDLRDPSSVAQDCRCRCEVC